VRFVLWCELRWDVFAGCDCVVCGEVCCGRFVLRWFCLWDDVRWVVRCEMWWGIVRYVARWAVGREMWWSIVRSAMRWIFGHEKW